jgi:hypothetical protein
MGDQRFVLNARRRSDLLALSFECVNLRLSADGHLERSDREKPAVIIVHFPGQHIAEQAFAVNAVGAGAFDPPPVRTAIAGGSRLAFQLPDSVESLPATPDALLTWDGWTPLLVGTAVRLPITAWNLPPGFIKDLAPVFKGRRSREGKRYASPSPFGARGCARPMCCRDTHSAVRRSDAC